MPIRLWDCHVAPEEADALLVAFLDDLTFWDQPSKTPRVSNTRTSISAKTATTTATRSLSTVQERSDSESQKIRQEQKLEEHSETSFTEEPNEEFLTSSWRSTIDPVTRRTYYYHTVTNETQWEKPAEVRALEKKRRREQRKRDAMFFRIMEDNIIASLRRGELIPSIPRKQTEKQGPPKEPLPLAVQPIRVRTISNMNEHLLSQIHNDSLRNLLGKPSSSSSTVSSPSSFASSVTSKPGMQLDKNQITTIPKMTIALSDSRIGRPPLPDRPSSGSSTTMDCYIDNLEFSPDAPRPDATPTSLETDTLRGEHLLDGFLDSEALSTESDSSTSPAPPPPKSRPLASSKHVRHNTVNTNFIESTMDAPNVSATILCVCGVFRAHIVQAYTANKGKHQRSPVSVSCSARVNLDVFLDNYGSPHREASHEVPAMKEIEGLYQEVYSRSQMAHDTIIMSLIYVERLIKETDGALAPTPENWKSVLLSCMILASKVWDDLSMWNIDFSNVSAASGLAAFTLQRINQLERALLSCLNFNVKVPASEYAKYYFLIRTMLMRSGRINKAVVAPLRREQGTLLENKTSRYQESQLQQNGLAHQPAPSQQNRRMGSFDFSWLNMGGSSSTEKEEKPPLGPVLNDQDCLEQLLSNR